MEGFDTRATARVGMSRERLGVDMRETGMDWHGFVCWDVEGMTRTGNTCIWNEDCVCWDVYGTDCLERRVVKALARVEVA